MTASQSNSKRRVSKFMQGIMCIILGITIMLISLAITWVTVDISDGLGPKRMITIPAKTWNPMLNALIMALICGVIVQFLLKGKLNYVMGILLVILEIIMILIPILTLFSSTPQLIAHSQRIYIFSDRHVVERILVHPLGLILTLSGGIMALGGTIFNIVHPYAQVKSEKKSLEFLSDLNMESILSDSDDSSFEKLVGSSEISLDNNSMWKALDAGIDFTDKDSSAFPS